MHQGKYCARNTRKRRKTNKKLHILLASIVLILGFSIGMTVAYLMENTGSVTNTFTPAEAGVTVDESFNSKTKSNIGATNSGNTKAYVRITLVEYWMKDNEIVAIPEHGKVTKSALNATDWFEVNGIYYYREPLDPGATANPAFATVTAQIPDGYTYHLDVLAEAIQAEPSDAVEAAWLDVNVGTDGKLAQG